MGGEEVSKPEPRTYQGLDYKGQRVVVVTGEKPKTMKIIQADGSFQEVPYEERRTGKLTPVPQMPEGFVGWTDGEGKILSEGYDE